MKWPIAIVLIISTLQMQAHQADISSTMLAEQKDGTWILQIRAALTAFEHEVHTHYGKDSYTTPEEFQDLVISHLKENLAIGFSEQDTIVFRNPYVKLGHETNAVFQVSGIPETFKTLRVKNSSFKDIHKNQSALIILKKGFSKKQFILNEENQHTVKLGVSDSKFELLTGSNMQVSSWSLYWMIPGLILVVLLFLFRKRFF